MKTNHLSLSPRVLLSRSETIGQVAYMMEWRGQRGKRLHPMPPPRGYGHCLAILKPKQSQYVSKKFFFLILSFWFQILFADIFCQERKYGSRFKFQEGRHFYYYYPQNKHEFVRCCRKKTSESVKNATFFFFFSFWLKNNLLHFQLR